MVSCGRALAGKDVATTTINKTSRCLSAGLRKLEAFFALLIGIMAIAFGYQVQTFTYLQAGLRRTCFPRHFSSTHIFIFLGDRLLEHPGSVTSIQ